AAGCARRTAERGYRDVDTGRATGRVAELTISVDRAEVRVVQDGLTRASGVTVVRNTALVLVELTRAVVVPYSLAPAGPQNPPAPATVQTNAEQEVLNLSKTKWRWMADRNVDSLAALFD